MEKILTFKEIDLLAEKLSKKLENNDLVALIGDLGTGKTTFVKKIAKMIGIKEEIRSPTFTLVQEYYSEDKNLFHFDVYRITNSEDVYEIGYEDYLNRDGVKVIEWADLIYSELPEEFIEIRLYHHDEEQRKVELKYIGNKVREEEILCYAGFRD